VALAYATVLASPFIVGTAIARSVRARELIARTHVVSAALGWSAFALVPVATVALEGGRHVAALAVLCPCTALTWWRYTDDADDDDGGGGGDDPDAPSPEPPEIDWERFMRDLDEYSASRVSGRS
jgi:hypothetical protein